MLLQTRFSKHTMTKQRKKQIDRHAYFIPLFVAFLILTSLTGPCRAAEPADWTKQITRESSTGKIEKLNAGGQEFLAVQTEQSGKKAKGQAIILHGYGQHPNWADVIKPLRTLLPKSGWSTLSIELPQAGKEAGEKEYAQLTEQSTSRILAAEAMLQGKETKKIIMIAYGLGARMAVDWLSKTPQPSVSALVIISMAGETKNSELKSNTDLLAIKIPVLDIIAENDTARVLSAALERRLQQSKMKQYRQLEIIAANPFYNQQEDELVKRIRGWLKVTFKPKKQQE